MSARNLVNAKLARQATKYPELELTPMDTSELSARDGALAKAIEHAALRRWLTLVAILQSKLKQDWPKLEPEVRGALLSGAAQMLLLDKLPDHAIINEAVGWTKRNGNVKAGGLVNAVLRRVSELRDVIVEKHDPKSRNEVPLADGRAWRLHEAVFAESETTLLAQQTSHPESVIRHWIMVLGLEKATQLAWHSLVHAPIIMTGMSPDEAANEPRLAPHDQEGFYVFQGGHEELSTLLRDHTSSKNRLRVQDPATAEAILSTRTMAPQIIIDYCAGVGTKTDQLLEMHPQARIIATDKSLSRLNMLRKTFKEHDRVDVVEFERIKEHMGVADLLVLDMPCSNSGVLARRVEAKYRLSDDSIEQLVDIQRQIVADSLALLKPGGRMLYVTCSIEAAENERQVEWIEKWHPWRTVRAVSRFPEGAPGEASSSYRDGGYYAMLEPME